MTRLLFLAFGLIAGYALRRPVCEREHRLPRHRDPAIVRQPPEDDEGILPPDPRTWRSAPDLRTWSGTWPTLTVTSEPAVVTTVPDTRTWPDTLEHDDRVHFAGLALGCPRCDADRWWRRGARRA